MLNSIILFCELSIVSLLIAFLQSFLETGLIGNDILILEKSNTYYLENNMMTFNHTGMFRNTKCELYSYNIASLQNSCNAIVVNHPVNLLQCKICGLNITRWFGNNNLKIQVYL